MKLLRPFVAVVMIFMLLFYTGGIYCFYEGRELAIKKAHSAEKLKQQFEDELQNMAIPLEQVRWIDEAEFTYQGYFYDIASSDVHNDTLFCLAYCDADEGKLLQDIMAFAEQDQETEDSGGFQAYPFFIQCKMLSISATSSTYILHQAADKKMPAHARNVICPPPEA